MQAAIAVCTFFIYDIYKTSFIFAATVSTVCLPFNKIPDLSTVSFAQEGLNSATVLPNPLPPEVANGITVLPEKS